MNHVPDSRNDSMGSDGRELSKPSADIDLGHPVNVLIAGR
jgi:hypothetical protein